MQRTIQTTDKREFDKKEYANWFRLVEEQASNYSITKLNKKDFEKFYIDGLSVDEAIMKFLYD